MASFTERLAYIITANGRNAVREFRNVQQAADQSLGGVEGRIGKFKGAASGIGAGLKGFGAGLLASFGPQAISGLASAASDLEQSAGAVQSVFGDAAGVITEFGETAAQTAGLSKAQVNQMAAVVGASLKGMGLDAQTAAEQVVVLERRAADLAAQFGGSTQQAIEAMASALRGERDPIEQYGVSIKQADVNARIAALGLDTSTAAAEKQATAFATLSLILESTTDAVGTFNREQDTLAGATARANAELENAKAELGEAVAPAATEGAKGLGRFFRGLNDVADAAGKLDRSPVGRFFREAFGVKLPDEPKRAVEDLGTAADQAADDQKRLEDAARNAAAAVDEEGAAAARTTSDIERYKEATDDLIGARLEAGGSARGLASAEERVREALYGTGEAYDDTRQRAETYQEAQDRIFGSVVELDEAHIRAREAVQGLAEALQQGGRSSEDAAAYMKRYYQGGSRRSDKYANDVQSATISAVRAAEAEVEAMVASGEIADTAGARKQALTAKLVALKNQFPAVAAQVDRYIQRLQRVPNLSTKADESTRRLAGSKRDLGEATDDLVEAARREADQQETVAGKHRKLLELLEGLKRKYPELTAALNLYIDDAIRAYERLRRSQAQTQTILDPFGNPIQAPAPLFDPFGNPVNRAAQQTLNVNVNVNEFAGDLRALARAVAREIGFTLNQGRR